MIQGRLEMMVSEYCVGGSFLGDLHKGACKFNCKEELFLGDRKDAQFPIATDQFCRMHVLNAHELSMTANVQLMAEIGVASLRIDGRNYDEQRLTELIAIYKKILGGAVEAPDNLPALLEVTTLEELCRLRTSPASLGKGRAGKAAKIKFSAFCRPRQ